jgi:predicted permease
MKLFMITAAIGTAAAIVDVLPMIKMELDRYSVISAFVFYFLMPLVIFHIEVPGLTWWLTGGLVTFLLAVPVMLIVAKEDKKAVPPMAISSVVLGTLIGMASHFMIG